jgi:hypothetical protein
VKGNKKGVGSSLTPGSHKVLRIKKERDVSSCGGEERTVELKERKE